MARPDTPRSGKLTAGRLEYLLSCVRRAPFHLDRAARAAGWYPSELLLLYLYGQTPGCTDPLCSELAFEIAQIQLTETARNHERIIREADKGTMRAIELLEAKLDESTWNISPHDNVAREIVNAIQSSEPVPILDESQGAQQPPALTEGNPPSA